MVEERGAKRIPCKRYASGSAQHLEKRQSNSIYKTKREKEGEKERGREKERKEKLANIFW